MTVTDAPPPPPPPTAFVTPPPTFVLPAHHGERFSVVAIVAFILAALTAVLYMTAKTLVPVLDGQSFQKQVDTIGTVFGVFGLLSILPIAAVIVLAHLGVRKATRGRRARSLGYVSLGIGYLLLVLYCNRLIVAAIAVTTFPHGGNFLQNNFYWA